MVLQFKHTPEEREAYIIIRRLTERNGVTVSDCEKTMPETVKLFRSYRTKYKVAYKTKLKPGRISSYASLDRYSWREVMDDRAVFLRLSKEDKRAAENEALREVGQYYNLIMRRDQRKRKQHPEINPISLGYDPRTRDWPSGRIEYKSYYYVVANKRRRKRNGK